MTTFSLLSYILLSLWSVTPLEYWPWVLPAFLWPMLTVVCGCGKDLGPCPPSGCMLSPYCPILQSCPAPIPAPWGLEYSHRGFYLGWGRATPLPPWASFLIAFPTPGHMALPSTVSPFPFELHRTAKALSITL